jgi:hypothetical protein
MVQSLKLVGILEKWNYGALVRKRIRFPILEKILVGSV